MHAVFTGTDGTVTESSESFSILSDARIENTLITDKSGYGANENVAVSFTMKNSGTNYMIPQLKVRLRIVNVLADTFYFDEKTVEHLFPATGVNLRMQWGTGLHPPGKYTLVVDAFLEYTVISTNTVDFTINTVSMVSGDVVINPASVLFGENIATAFTVANTGNTVASGFVRAVIIEPATQTTVAQAEQVLSLAMNSSETGEFIFQTRELELKPYSLTLQYVSPGNQKSIASASFTVRDGTPPVLSVVSPVAGTTYNSAIPISALASDNASGVERVEYQLDGGSWKLLPLADPSNWKYAAIWEPTNDDNGQHSIRFKAFDRAGNETIAVIVSFHVQMDDIPPMTTITVGAPQYAANDTLYISASTQFTLNATDNFSGVAKTEYRTDGGQWLPYAPFAIPGEGEHVIYYRSADKAGNSEREKTLKVMVDTTPPTTVITASDPLLAGGMNTVSLKTTFSLAAEDNLAGVKRLWYRVDAGQWLPFAEVVTLAGLNAGAHTISFSASDNVGNDETEHTLTVRLVQAEIKKEISLEPLVLVGAWTDNLNKVKNHSAIDSLKAILTSFNIEFHIALNGEEFKISLRSGRYTTYLLIDYKDEKVGEELREAINYGDSLFFIKTRPSADPSLDEMFGVKFSGKTSGSGLPVHLEGSPLGVEGSLPSIGKSVVATVEGTAAQVYGSVIDKNSKSPCIIYNGYGSGKVLLFTFDLLSSADKEKVVELVAGSLNILKRERHEVRALGSLPVKISVAASTEPLGLQVQEYVPASATVDTVNPQGVATETVIVWQQGLDASAKAEFGYHLNLPDAKGEYMATTDVRYVNNGDYRLYERLKITAAVGSDSADLLQGVIIQLSEIQVARSSDLVIVTEGVNILSGIALNPLDLKEAEKCVENVSKVIRLIRGLSMETADIRLKLDELLKILQRKWYLHYAKEYSG